MKKTTSFHLDESILKEITDYQKENNITSRNAALERMIMDIKNIKRELDDKTALAEYAKMMLLNSSIENKVIPEVDNKPNKNSNIKNKEMRNSIKTAFDDMPE